MYTHPSPTSRGLGCFVSFLMGRTCVQTAASPRAGTCRLRRLGRQGDGGHGGPAVPAASSLRRHVHAPKPHEQGAWVLRFVSDGADVRADGGKSTSRDLPPAAVGETGRRRSRGAGSAGGQCLRRVGHASPPHEQGADLLRFVSVPAVERIHGGRPTSRGRPPAAVFGTGDGGNRRRSLKRDPQGSGPLSGCGQSPPGSLRDGCVNLVVPWSAGRHASVPRARRPTTVQGQTAPQTTFSRDKPMIRRATQQRLCPQGKQRRIRTPAAPLARQGKAADARKSLPPFTREMRVCDRMARGGERTANPILHLRGRRAPCPAGASSAAQSPAAQSPAAQSPAAQSPAAQSPAAQSPAAQSPAAQSPAAQSPAAQSPAAQSPAAQSPAAQSPAAQSPAAQSPAAQSPAAQSPAAQSPAAQSPAAQSPTVQKPENLKARDPRKHESPMTCIACPSVSSMGYWATDTSVERRVYEVDERRKMSVASRTTEATWNDKSPAL